MEWKKHWMKLWLSSKLKKTKPACRRIQGGNICLNGINPQGQRLLSRHQEGNPSRSAEPIGSGFTEDRTINRKRWALQRSAAENDDDDGEESRRLKDFRQ